MANYSMLIQYDGTNYKGWQVQNSTNNTIQGKLQNILSILAGSPVEVIGSGRTDAGVHALGQVANFHIDMPDDTSAMRKAAALLTGKHDYKSFCGNSHMKKSTVRTITSIDIKEVTDDNGLREVDIFYSGDGFLQNMIRILTGTLIEVGTGRRAPESMCDLLEAKDRKAAGYTAPPQGLCLMEVYY